MVQVVLVDDEIRVCNLIRALVDWESLDMNVAGIASNGAEAIALIREIRPEIVITDIRMPGCTGLELIEQAREVNPDTAFIIISGYTHFEYAQMAIKFGVRDYILKPIDRQELNTALRRIKSEIDARRKEQVLSEQIRRTMISDRKKMRICYFMDVVNLHGPRMTLEQLNREYRFSFQPGAFRGLAIKMDYNPSRYDEAALETVAQHIREFVLAQLQPLCSDLELWFDHGTGIGLCGYRAKNAKPVMESFQNCLNDLQMRNEIYPEIAFAFAVGPETTEAERLNDTILTAESLLDERLIRSGNRVIDYAPPLSGLPILENINEFVKYFRLSLERSNVALAEEAVQRLKTATLEEHGVTGQEIKKTVSLAATRMAEEAGSGIQYETLHKAFCEGSARCSTADALFDFLKQMAQMQIHMLEAEQQSDEAHPIRVARQYIEQHYMEQITLEQVAAQAGFNTSYFSTVFKKKCGMGFLEYLTLVRIDKAKELLAQTDTPITEICFAIGYSDLKHFNRMFKKVTELKPSEYRRLYGR